MPFEILVCIKSKAAYYKDEDQIRINDDNITFHKGMGVIETRNSVFLHGGLAFGNLNSVALNTNNIPGSYNYTDSFNAIRGNLHKKDPTFMAGIEFRTGKAGFDFCYLKSIKSIYDGADLRNGVLVFQVKLLL